MYAQQYAQRLKTSEKCREKLPPPCTKSPPFWLPFNHRLNTVQTPIKRHSAPPESCTQSNTHHTPHWRRGTAQNTRPAPLCRSPYAPIPHFKPLSRLFFPPPSNLPPHTSGKPTNEKSDEKQPPRHLSSLSVQPNSTPRRSNFASN